MKLTASTTSGEFKIVIDEVGIYPLKHKKNMNKEVYAVGSGSFVYFSQPYSWQYVNYMLDNSQPGTIGAWCPMTIANTWWILVSGE